MDRIIEIINNAEPTEDVREKFDLDFEIISASSRGYPPRYNANGKWSIYVGIYLGEDDASTFEAELFADTKKEVILLAKCWYRDLIRDVIETLLGERK